MPDPMIKETAKCRSINACDELLKWRRHADNCLDVASDNANERDKAELALSKVRACLRGLRVDDAVKIIEDYYAV